MRLIYFSFTLLFLTTAAQAQFNDKSYLYKRAGQREVSRWTLQEWMAQKDRNRMMDLWLALHSPSPYEAMLGAAYKSDTVEISTNPDVETHYISSDGYATAHASLIGVTFEYENNVQEKFHDVNGMVNLRVFGDSIQSTFLAFHYGQRTRTITSASLTDSAYKNQFGQVTLQLYLMKYFGIDGFHRQYIPATEEKLQQEIRGSLSEAGVFIDFKALRIFGSWYQDVQVIKSLSIPYQETTTLRTGTKTGIKLFF